MRFTIYVVRTWLEVSKSADGQVFEELCVASYLSRGVILVKLVFMQEVVRTSCLASN